MKLSAPSGTRYATVDLLKILLTVGIVFRHAELVGQAGLDAAYDALSHGIQLLTELCVPLFFVLSGFLFFRNPPERADFRFFRDKLRRRIRTLLVPYLIANVFAFLAYWAAWRFAPGMMDGYFGDSWRNPLFVFWTGPVNLSLWFIRDLFLALLLAPLYWLLVRFTRFWGVLVLGLFWYLTGTPAWCNFFFVLGAWAAVSRTDIAGACRKTGPWWLLLYLCCFAAAWRDPALTKLSVLAGLPLCLAAADRLVRTLRREIPSDRQAWVFFIYLYHYIPVLALKKLLPQAIGPDSFPALLGCYLLTALLTLGLLSGLYAALKRFTPRAAAILVGGRQ